MTIAQRDVNVIWHPYTQMQTADAPLAIVKGEGVYLFDENGKKYIDAISSWWVNIHGHAHPYIAQKVFEQLQLLEHTLFAGFTHKPAVELAENLLKILPSNQSKIFYSDNGSTAVEVALKMSIQYWHNKGTPKNKIIIFENSYHGDTFGSMSVSDRGLFTKAFVPLLFDVIQIPTPSQEKKEEVISILKSEIMKKRNEIAAFIFEPLILAAGGMLIYEPTLLDELIKICKENNIIIIADEVMTGFGRTGKWFACDYMDQKPDIICLSKAITGGTMALGVTSTQKEIYNAFLSEEKIKTFFHGHSYTANPLACVASIASLELLLQENTRKNISRIETQHKNFAKKLQQYASVENIRCLGTIIAFDIKTNEKTSYLNSIRDRMYHFFLNEGVILRPLGNTVYIMPPYCITEKELEFIYDVIEKGVKKDFIS